MKVAGFYFITDRRLAMKVGVSLLNSVKEAIEGGASVVQYREKELSTRGMIREALEISKLCRSFNTPFIVNDRIDVALAVGADGVHLGKEDTPYEIARKLLGEEKIIGISANSVEDAVMAEEMGADYIGLGPIFPTSTKKDAGSAIGVDVIRKVKKEVGIPIIAIGGINLHNIGDVVEAGADGVAAISAVFSSRRVRNNVRELVARMSLLHP